MAADSVDLEIKAITSDSDILLLVVKMPAVIFRNESDRKEFADDLKTKIEASGRKCPPIKVIPDSMDITPIRMTGGQTCAAS